MIVTLTKKKKKKLYIIPMIQTKHAIKNVNRKGKISQLTGSTIISCGVCVSVLMLKFKVNE